MTDLDGLRVAVFATDGVEESEIVEPIKALRDAGAAGLVRGRTMTSFHTLQDDIRNAGGAWVDEPVAEDGTIVTSRQPTDIPLYNAAMIELFARSMTGASSEPAGMRGS